MVGLERVIAGTHRVHDCFTQPPLAFYERIINDKPWPYVIITAEDASNPVIHALIKHYDHVKFKQETLEQDIVQLLSAKNLVVGYGTFGITWALMSVHLSNLYCPLMPERIFGKLYPENIEGLEIQSFDFKNYIPLGKWKASKSQKYLMLSYGDENIVNVKPNRS